MTYSLEKASSQIGENPMSYELHLRRFTILLKTAGILQKYWEGKALNPFYLLNEQLFLRNTDAQVREFFPLVFRPFRLCQVQL